MCARDRNLPALLIRIASLGVLLAVIGILVVHLASRRGVPTGGGPDESAGGSGRAGLKEDVRHLEYRDGKVWLDAVGDRAVLEDDGSTRLEGNVRIVDRRAERGSELIIRAASVSFDKNLTRFLFGGGVEIREGGALLESASFEYDKAGGRLGTKDGVLYTSPGLVGTSRAFLYDLEADVLVLSKGFRLEIRSGGPAAAISVLEGETLRYERSRRRGEAGGGVTIGGEEFLGSARGLGFELTEDEGSLRRATMSGGAKAALPARSQCADETPAQSLEADVIAVAVRPGTSEVSELRSRGGSVLAAALPRGIRALVRGERLRVAFGEKGVLLGFEAPQGAGVELEGGEEGEQRISGRSVGYDREIGALAATGDGEEPARAESRGLSIEARSISVGVSAEEIRTRGGVKGVFVPDSGDGRIGFFEPGRPVFFACREFGKSGDSKGLDFRGDVRLWQEREFLETEELRAEEETGATTAGGGVRAGLVRGTRSEAGEMIEIRGERMARAADEGPVRFEGECGLEAGDVRLTAETIVVTPGPGRTGAEKLEARSGVVVRWRSAEGRSDEAIFEFASETLVLIGKPVLEERNKSTARGDKLTFRLADDKIFVENEGQERSVAVIKSRAMRCSLRAVDLEKRFGSRKVVENVTIEVGAGEIVGFLGPNGAGKTTTFSIIMGLVPPDRGRVLFRDEDITGLPMFRRARMGIGFLPQEPSAFRKMDAEDNLTAVLKASAGGRGELKRRTSEALAEFGLEAVARSRAVTLSGGERRRLEIARAMILNPDILLLDEPFTGVDPLAVQELQEILRSLAGKGIGILLTDHSVRETLRITDRAYILDGGGVIASGAPRDLVASETVRKSYLGGGFRL